MALTSFCFVSLAAFNFHFLFAPRPLAFRSLCTWRVPAGQGASLRETPSHGAAPHFVSGLSRTPSFPLLVCRPGRLIFVYSVGDECPLNEEPAFGRNYIMGKPPFASCVSRSL